MITGMNADKTACGSNADPMPPEDHPTIMSLLAEAGYRTHGVGKCHFTPDPWAMRGFQSRDTQEEIAGSPSGDDYVKYLKKSGQTHVLEPNGIRGEMYYVPQPSQLPAKHHPTNWVGDRSVRFIKQRKRSSQPWYLYAGFIHPHPPFAPPNPWHKLYRAPDMPLPFIPENIEELTCFINQIQNRYKFRDRGLDMNLIRCIRAYYYACISFVDHQVGRILSALEAEGELDNTLIAYTSDHGELLGDYASFGKRSFHEVTMRVPMIVRQNRRFKKGGRCSAPASLVDLLPTFLKAAGKAPPPEVDGVDLSGIARGKKRADPVYFHYHRGKEAILGGVKGPWKYAWSAPDNREYLFDTRSYYERRNLADSPKHSRQLNALRKSLQARAAEHPFSKSALDKDGGWKQRTPQKMPKDPDKGLLYQDPPKAKPKLPDPYVLTYPGSKNRDS